MITVMVFGQLADIIQCKQLDIKEAADTQALVRQLEDQYPRLTQSKYVIAVNKRVITENTELINGATVALLPPFSGG